MTMSATLFRQWFLSTDESLYTVELVYAGHGLDGDDLVVTTTLAAESFWDAKTKVLSRPGVGRPIGGRVIDYFHPENWTEFTLDLPERLLD